VSGKRGRVLLLITDSHIGGTEKVVAFVARGLAGEGLRPVVGSVKPGGEMLRSLAEEGIETFSLGFTGRGLRGALAAPLLLPALNREIRRREIGLVHSFLFLANMLGRLSAVATRRPNLSSIRVEEREKAYHLLLERLTRGLVDRWLVPSDELARFAAGRCRIDPGLLEVIPNPAEEPRPAAPRLRPMLGLAAGVPLVGIVGRLHRQKGVDLAIEAWARLPEGGRPHLAVIGDGPERTALEAATRSAGLGSRVHFTGWITPAGECLPELDLLLLPSRWEGLPNTLLEAMAAGVPVAAAAVGGVPGLVEEGITGRLLPPGDPAAIAAAVTGFLADRGGAARMAGAARAKVAAGHASAAVLARYLALYDKIRQGGRG
jgi:glycosyltransferase involved in cell wall biosynthesis